MRNDIVLDMAWHDYVSAEGLNPSTAVRGIKSARHLRFGQPPKATRAARVGTVAHAILFDRDIFDRFSIYTGKIRRGKAYDEFAAANPGKELLLMSEYEVACEIAEAVAADPMAREALTGCSHEVSLFAEIDGLQCKGRVDALHETSGRLVDLKCTADIDKRAFGRVFARLNYGFKLAFYHKLLRYLGKPVESTLLITAEMEPPYDVAVVAVHPEVIESHTELVDSVIDEYRHGLATDYWPGVAATFASRQMRKLQRCPIEECDFPEGAPYELSLWSTGEEEEVVFRG